MEDAVREGVMEDEGDRVKEGLEVPDLLKEEEAERVGVREEVTLMLTLALAHIEAEEE